MKKIFVLTIVMLILTGCSQKSNDSVKSEYNIITVKSENNDSYTDTINLIYYTDPSGDLYYRVLPTNVILESNLEYEDYYGGYPTKWVKVDSPIR